LVNDLLDLSVIESGKFDLRLIEENLAKLVAERAELVASSAEKKQIKLITDLQEVANSLFDVDRMRQVIDNLLTNAIKFSLSGTTVQLACRQTEHTLEITVADQGPGIPSEEIGKLFGTFQKLSVQPTGGREEYRAGAVNSETDRRCSRWRNHGRQRSRQRHGLHRPHPGGFGFLAGYMLSLVPAVAFKGRRAPRVQSL